MKVKSIKLYLPLILIMLIGLVWRTINFENTFIFNHDQDLYSWIAKDIVVNHHQRLIGQVTSVDGVFIGSFYYYLMAFFYWIFRMNPVGAVVPLSLIGLLNIWSFYFVVSKHFGRKSGMWAAFLYAISWGAALYDRWSVPTQPTITWCIWFIFVTLEFYQGNWKMSPFYGFLVGFIWQIHIALLPVAILPILAYLVGDKFGYRIKTLNIKMMWVGIVFFVLASSPFWIFEIKHNFSQIKAMAAGSQVDMGGPTGWQKIEKILDASGREIQVRVMNGVELSPHLLFWIIWLILCFYLIKTKRLAAGRGLVLNVWIFLIMLAQFWSKRIVSEYYFTNLVPIVILLFSVLLASCGNKIFSTIVAVTFLVINWKWVDDQKYLDESYFFRKELVTWVKNDIVLNQYPCVAVNYITSFGKGVGFRYLYWYEGVNLVKPGTQNVPTYNVFIPKEEMGTKENGVSFGRFGIAKGSPPKVMITQNECGSEVNQLDPLLGYTQ